MVPISATRDPADRLATTRDLLAEPGYIVVADGDLRFGPLTGNEFGPVGSAEFIERVAGSSSPPGTEPMLEIVVSTWEDLLSDDPSASDVDGPNDAVPRVLLWDSRQVFAPHPPSGSFVALRPEHVLVLCDADVSSGLLSCSEAERARAERELRIVGLRPVVGM